MLCALLMLAMWLANAQPTALAEQIGPPRGTSGGVEDGYAEPDEDEMFEFEDEGEGELIEFEDGGEGEMAEFDDGGGAAVAPQVLGMSLSDFVTAYNEGCVDEALRLSGEAEDAPDLVFGVLSLPVAGSEGLSVSVGYNPELDEVLIAGAKLKDAEDPYDQQIIDRFFAVARAVMGVVLQDMDAAALDQMLASAIAQAEALDAGGTVYQAANAELRYEYSQDNSRTLLVFRT